MEPKENSIPTGIVVLWGLPFLFQLLAWQLTSALAPTNASHCPQTCGDVEIPYPFGIGPNCSLTGFELSCNETAHKPFYFNVEVLNISLSSGQARINNEISWQCYNITSRNTSSERWRLNFVGTPYRFSNNLNMFTAIGCDTLAYITSNNSMNDYATGCVSLCDNKASLTNGSCSGIGCCHTEIPKGINYYEVSFDKRFNSSDAWNFSRCSYAVLAETARFEFKISYITTDELQKIGKAPLVLDWAIGNETCQEARQNKTSYACVSNNSVCVDSLNGPGYLCSCSKGYQGNPYLLHGCQDIDECANKDPCSSGVCHNIEGSYMCFHNRPRAVPRAVPRALKLAPGIGISLLIILIFILCIHIIRQKKKFIKVKEKNFQEYGGKLLLEEIGKQQGLGFKIFTEEELEQATNKFHKNNILGFGGHGTVYKGILKDNRVVAIKKTKIIDKRQKKEFGKEMLILSQINHKNIVKLLGCCLQVEVPMLVYEHISNGTLFQLIHCNDHRIHLSLEARLRIALESAEALAYLHSSASPPIIHGDVKSSNILLDDHFTAKISELLCLLLGMKLSLSHWCKGLLVI